jgi:hypothetical protein
VHRQTTPPTNVTKHKGCIEVGSEPYRDHIGCHADVGSNQHNYMVIAFDSLFAD